MEKGRARGGLGTVGQGVVGRRAYGVAVTFLPHKGRDCPGKGEMPGSVAHLL